MDGPEFPYSVGPEDNPINFHMNAQDQMSIYKDNEKYQKAPPILPFELQQMNELLSNTFVSLAELRNMLSKAKANENISSVVVNQINNKIDKINELILDIPEDLSKISI
jgi:hypothetical protein|tara:strand:- start:2369 stop:2695 length:327 start_codon:yes stop_codon:yes gene_type:complete